MAASSCTILFSAHEAHGILATDTDVAQVPTRCAAVARGIPVWMSCDGMARMPGVLDFFSPVDGQISAVTCPSELNRLECPRLMKYKKNLFSLVLAVFLSAVLLPVKAQNSGNWQLVWADEFSQLDGSSPDASKWAYDTGATGWGNAELQHYTTRTNNVRIEDGKLVIEALRESYLGANYTSARMKTFGKVSWLYGRMEARIKIPRTAGIWPAFWMLGTNIASAGWPECGEIDIMENIGREPKWIHGTIHGPGYSGRKAIGAKYALPGNEDFADNYHVYAVEWTTNALKWFVDGVQFHVATASQLPAGAHWVYTRPQFLILNVAVGGNWPGNPDETTVFPQQMFVDYVRVYSGTNAPASATILFQKSGIEAGGFEGSPASGGGHDTLTETFSSVAEGFRPEASAE
jgi:beta-glucanase (GH16 family)